MLALKPPIPAPAITKPSSMSAPKNGEPQEARSKCIARVHGYLTKNKIKKERNIDRLRLTWSGID
jgi:hypothetical protein